MHVRAIKRARDEVKVAVWGEGEPFVHRGFKFGAARTNRQPRNWHLLPAFSTVETDTGDHTAKTACSPHRDHIFWIGRIDGKVRLDFHIVCQRQRRKSARFATGPRTSCGD